jgi:hypothetical protein
MKYLTLALLLTSSSLAYADCITYQGGVTECTALGITNRDRGNTKVAWLSSGITEDKATIHRHTGRYSSVTAPTDVAP